MADFTEQNQANRRSLHVPGRAAAMHYVIALVLVAIALAVRLALQPLLESEAPFLFFVPAVLAATGIGGFGPGMFATLLSVSAVIFLVSGAPSFGAAEATNVIAFIVIGGGISWVGELLALNRMRISASDRNTVAREAHLKSILNTIPDAMIVIDEQGSMQSFSPAAERLFGYQADEVIGKNIRMLMP